MTQRVISADNHVNEPPHVFDRVPPSLRDRAPKMLRGADGGDDGTLPVNPAPPTNVRREKISRKGNPSLPLGHASFP